jgi:Terpene synthase family 2, C-terminal metal binding
MVIDLIELAERITLPEPVRASDSLDEMRRVANNVICWSNDIVSLDKEIARGEVNNLVIVLQQEQNLTLQESVDRVGDMVEDQIHLFEDAERQLPGLDSDLDNDVQKYVAGLRAWMRANLDWSAETARFSQVEETRAGQSTSYREDLLASYEAPGRFQMAHR